MKSMLHSPDGTSVATIQKGMKISESFVLFYIYTYYIPDVVDVVFVGNEEVVVVV